jgi:hypothetical protein
MRLAHPCSNNKRLSFELALEPLVVAACPELGLAIAEEEPLWNTNLGL